MDDEIFYDRAMLIDLEGLDPSNADWMIARAYHTAHDGRSVITSHQYEILKLESERSRLREDYEP